MADSGPDPGVDLRPADLEQLRARGITVEELQRQLACFREGFPPLDLRRPATVGDGIEVLDPAESEARARAWAEAASAGRLLKFVPASGAASRMFRALAARAVDPRVLDDAALERARRGEDGEDRDVARFFDHLDEFPFAPALREIAPRAFEDPDRRAILRALLDDDGLGYGNLPKGLIAFHREGARVRTAFEEHLLEARETVADAAGRVRVHFTVAPQFRERIEEHLAAAAEREDGDYELSFSEQSPATDTLAVDLRGQPFRDDRGDLVFRPGGHGALIYNLDALGADLVYIKNIDNVAPRAGRERVVRAQRDLVGVLVSRQRAAHQWWRRLGEDPASVTEAAAFVREKLHREIPPAIAEDPAALRAILARPLRVCGMVRNQGEPGGGPFWVGDPAEGASLQIVETSQIDRRDPQQAHSLARATHFNPVDLVCALRDPQGRPLDLLRHVDPATGFLSEKSHQGRPLRALERPGLWNGAMARWNTIFVEVPVETFVPVKTVLDLLREAHRGTGTRA